MANTIHVDVVSVESQIYSGEAEFIVLPGIEGELGIYPRHAPLFTQIKPGALRIKVPDRAEEELLFVQGGFLEVQPHRGDRPRRHGNPREGPGRSEGARSEAGGRRSDAEQDVEGRDRNGRSRARLGDGATRGDPQDAAPGVIRGIAASDEGGHEPPLLFVLPNSRQASGASVQCCIAANCRAEPGLPWPT